MDPNGAKTILSVTHRSGRELADRVPFVKTLRCTVCDEALSRHESAVGAICRKLSCRTVLAIRGQQEASRQRQAEVDATVAWFAERGGSGRWGQSG